LIILPSRHCFTFLVMSRAIELLAGETNLAPEVTHHGRPVLHTMLG
jgi:hypothetical protein